MLKIGFASNKIRLLDVATRELQVYVVDVKRKIKRKILNFSK